MIQVVFSQTFQVRKFLIFFHKKGMEAIAAIMSQICKKKTVHKFLPWQNQPGCRPLIKVNCLVLLQPFVMDQRHVSVWTQQLRREYIMRSKFLGRRKHGCGHNDYVSAMNIFWNSEASFPPGGKGGGFPDFMPPPGMPGSYMTVICLVATVPELGFSIHFTTKTIICCKALVGPQVPL